MDGCQLAGCLPSTGEGFVSGVVYGGAMDLVIVQTFIDPGSFVERLFGCTGMLFGQG